MQRTHTYECMCLLDNREVRKGWQPLKELVVGMFKKHGAELLSARRWDERRLAYQIKGQQRGTYLLAYFKADTQQVTGIRRDLQFNEGVLRSLVLGCEEVPQSAYEPEADFDVNAIPVDDSQVVSSTPSPAEPAPMDVVSSSGGGDEPPTERTVELREEKEAGQ